MGHRHPVVRWGTLLLGGVVAGTPRRYFILLAVFSTAWLLLKSEWHRVPIFSDDVELGEIRETREYPPPVPGFTSLDRLRMVALAPSSVLESGARYCVALEVESPSARDLLRVAAFFSGDEQRPRQEAFSQLRKGRRELRFRFDFERLEPWQTGRLQIAFPERARAGVFEMSLFRRTPAGDLVEWVAAGLSAVSACLALIALRRRNPVWAEAMIVGIIAFAIVSVTLPYSRNGDPFWNTPTGLSLLMTGDVDVDEFHWQRSVAMAFLTHHHDGHVYNYFPIGMTLLCLPSYALGMLLFCRDMDAIDGFAAHVAFAMVAALFYYLSAKYSARRSVALVLTVVLMAGTPNIWYGTGGTNSHSGVQLMIIAALICLYKARSEGRDFLAAASALPLSVAVLCRPTAAVAAVASAVYVLFAHRRAFPLFAAVGAGAAGLFFLFNYQTYNALLPPYYLLDRLSFQTWGTGLAAQTISPNRGLFVHTPLYLYSVVAGFRALRGGTALDRLLAATPVPFAFVIAAFPYYSGGWGFGSRFYLDVAPMLVLLLSSEVRLLNPKQRPVRTALFGLLFAASLWIHSRSLSFPVFQWNFQPTDLMEHQERVWDIRDMQILRGLGSSP